MLSLNARTASTFRSPKTIVCVDDNEFVLEILDWYLESRGYTVVPCSDATRALEVVGEASPDAVTLDFEMPDMNGGEVAAAIRSKNPSLPLVMFSGSTEIPQKALDLVDRFVSKDTADGFAVLATALDSVFTRNRKRRSASARRKAA